MRTNLRTQTSPRGSALLAVLWVIALLSALVTTTMMLVQEDTDTMIARQQIFRARMLAEAGLAIAAHPDVRPEDKLLLEHEVSEGEGYKVTLEGEESRLNPNVLLQREDRVTLGRIFRAWGLKQDQAIILIDSMLDWVDDNPFVLPQGAEARFYNQPGLPFNRPFRNIDEMAMVRGMNVVDQLYPSWREWFSVYSSGIVDVNEASAEVLSAVTGADPVLAGQFVARRTGRDGIPHTEDDAPYQDINSALRALGVGANPAMAQIIGTQSSITRINSTGIVGNFQRTLFVVINRGLQPSQPGGQPGGQPQGAGGFGAATILDMNEHESRETTGRFEAKKR